MNTDPGAIKILCYGDSNTWGQKPDKTGRYAADIRWTGRLQQSLGSKYYVIEEGLGSRTTDLDYKRKPGRNGKAYFIPCLASHSPLDIVVLMLGTNDLKTEYQRTAENITEALGGLVSDVREFAQNLEGNVPKIILVSPIEINSRAPRFAEFYTGYYDERSMVESRKLGATIGRLAQQTGCEFLDAATVAKPGEDGIHFDEESETSLADALYEVIRNVSDNR